MAKALMGHMGSDPRVVSRLLSENRLLRQRVADLEAYAMRLHAENDRLAADVAVAPDLRVLDEHLQPA